MISGKRWLCRALIMCISAGTLMVAQDNSTVSTDGKQTQDITSLKAMIAAQQKQLDALKQALDNQQKLLDQTLAQEKTAAQKTTPANVGQVASIAPLFPAAAPATLAAIPAIPAPQKNTTGTAGSNPCEGPPDTQTPPYIRIGDVCAVPIGFMDLTSVWRSKDAGSGIGSNFGNIPYNNTPAGRLSEFHFSPQNSRIGFRIDGNWKGTHFIAYNENDFLGTSGGNNLTVTSGSWSPRLRLFWIDVRKGSVEFLAGQSWSMLTPNRKGVSALPGDIFYGQEIDVNYLTGLPWTRQPGVRVIYHANEKLAVGFSAENPEQYMGGSAGGPSITLPSCCAAFSGGQLSNNTNTNAVPNLAPDFIAKIAADPTSRLHFEVAGLERSFRSFNPATNTKFNAFGGGVSANAMLGITDNFRLTTTNFWSDGGGRYLFGQAPDVIVRSNGSLSPVHAGGFTEGFETTVKNTLLYGYWGGTYVGRDVALDTNGSLIGYGYHGSSNAQNRMTQEVTFGFNQTLWKNPRYGAINFMGQYMYEIRAPWYYALNEAGGKNTQDTTIYFNIRYSLPGSMPSF